MLCVTSGIARAQGRPFTFTVAFPDAAAQRITARYDAGYGEGTFEPLAGDRVEQDLELDVPIANRVLILASTGLALNGPSATRGLGQVEAMVDALRFWGWHLAASAGARREFDGSTMALSRVSLSRSASTWSFAANAMVGKTVAGADEAKHDDADLYASLGATARVAPFLDLGVETVASDIEGFWDTHEAEGGATVFAGPLVSLRLPGGLARLTVSGGPILRTTGNGVPAYVGLSSAEGLAPTVRRTGYLLRTAVSLAL